jgi:hypothetical protein
MPSIGRGEGVVNQSDSGVLWVGVLHYPPPLEHMEALGAHLLPIDLDHFWDPWTSRATPRMLDHFDLPPQRLFDPCHKTTLLVSAIDPDELQARKAALERFKQEFAPIMILNTGLVHLLMYD